MGAVGTVEKVSFEIIEPRGKAPICRVTVESPQIARIDKQDKNPEDAIETLAWAIDPATCRRARARLAEVMNRNPLSGWGTFRFTGHA